MAGWTKLFSSIITSSIWIHDDKVLRTWVAMLALADAKGRVEGSIPGFASICRMDIPEMERVLGILTSSDAYSRTKEEDGRRIRDIPGGWEIINYQTYKEKAQEGEGSRAPYMREYRAAKKGVTPVTRNIDTDTALDTDDREADIGDTQVIDQSDESPLVSSKENQGEKAEPPAVTPKNTPHEAPNAEEKEPNSDYFEQDIIVGAFQEPTLWVKTTYNFIRKTYPKMALPNSDKHAQIKLQGLVDEFMHKNRKWGMAFSLAGMRRFISDPKLRSGSKFSPVPYAMFNNNAALLLEMAAKQCNAEDTCCVPIYENYQVSWTFLDYDGPQLINKENPVDPEQWTWIGETWDTWEEAVDAYNAYSNSETVPEFIKLN